MGRSKKALLRSEQIRQLRTHKFDEYHICEKANTLKRENNATRKISLWVFVKKVWLVLANKTDTRGDMTSGAFALLVSVAFKAVAVAGFLAVLMGLWAVVVNLPEYSWQSWQAIVGTICGIGMIVMTLFIVALYSVIMWGASNEMRKERDKNYIVAVFSGVVSFAALIVALVALVKG